MPSSKPTQEDTPVDDVRQAYDDWDAVAVQKIRVSNDDDARKAMLNAFDRIRAEARAEERERIAKILDVGAECYQLHRDYVQSNTAKKIAAWLRAGGKTTGQ